MAITFEFVEAEAQNGFGVNVSDRSRLKGLSIDIAGMNYIVPYVSSRREMNGQDYHYR